MAIQLVPYNNAMRLGQGFNSYTQQICIDDAVVIDPARAENVVTNDGTTMRIMAEKSSGPSVWNRQPEVVTDDRAAASLNRYKLEKAVEEIEDSPTESIPEDPKQSGAVSTETSDTGNGAATAAGSEETPAPPEEPAAAVAMEKSDSLDVITRDDLDEKTSEAADDATAEEVASTEAASDATEKKSEPENVVAASEEKSEPADKATDTATTTEKSPRTTPRTLPADKRAGRSSSVGAGAKKAQGSAKPAAVRPTTSQATLQRAASKLKADALRKKEEEKQKEAARKKDDEERRKREEKKMEEQRQYEEEVAKAAREDERARRNEDRAEQRQIRTEKRAFDAKRREDARKAIEAAANLKATSLEDLKKITAQNQFAERFIGMLENSQQYTFDATGSRGPSQTVTYTSRFVDRLSDVTEDMCISGSLSIKAGKIGGSGKGSFVDSDKFKESDMNFYISVKVVNQTVNFKDALVYNPVRSVDKDNFKQVFGDSFISGFVEGGEFNALVSMKILNKAKKTDIQAEAKVALTAGPVNIEAEANVGIARSNLETNTETTIQVSWSGGGHIKPMDQQWDIPSLMQAAARFPDLVADCPQRIYAILTKYDTLRSFVALKPAGCTPLQYENAQIYTNALLDSFMSYKSLYKQLGEHIFRIKGRTLEIIPWDETGAVISATNADRGTKDTETGLYPYKEDLTRFEASIKGLSDARTAIRRQMARIVNEVDLIEKDPKLATDEDHKEPFQSPNAFETRVPSVDVPARLKRRTVPLTGRAIKAKELTEAEQKAELEKDEELSNAPSLYSAGSALTKDEIAALDAICSERPGIGNDIRVTSPVGSDTQGKYFNNLDILKPDWTVESIKFHIYRGFISYAGVTYENGLLIGKGVKHNDAKSVTFGPFNSGERIISASIETGIRSTDQDKQPRVLAVGLFTNRGRSFLATAPTESKSDNKYSKDNVIFEQVQVTHFDGPIENGTFQGFFGRSDDDLKNEGAIWRLGLIWGRSSGLEAANTEAKPLGLASISSIVADSHAPQGGVFSATVWRAEQGSLINRKELTFNPAYSQPPLMISGIRGVVEAPKTALHADVQHGIVASDKTSVIARTIASTSFDCGVSWLSIPKTDKHIETGTYEIVGDEVSDTSSGWVGKAVTIPFSKRFQKAPTVKAWCCKVHGSADYHSIWIGTTVTAEAITIKFWRMPLSGNNFNGLRAGWIAYDASECPNIQVGDINSTTPKRVDGRINFPKEFKAMPTVFLAVQYFTSESNKKLYFAGWTKDVKEDGFNYDYGPLETDHEMRQIGYVWIAIA